MKFMYRDKDENQKNNNSDQNGVEFIPPIRGIENKDIKSLNNNANILFGEKKYEEAIVCYNRALEIAPELGAAWNNKGLVLNMLGRFLEAVFCYDRAIEIDPSFKEAWNNKGNSLVEQDRFWEGINCYEKATGLDSSYAHAWYNKGYTLTVLGDLENAVLCFEKALEEDHNLLFAWNGKGNAIRKLLERDDMLHQGYSININSDIDDITRKKLYKEAIRCHIKELELSIKLD